MKYIKHLDPDQNLQRLAYMSAFRMSNPMGEFSKWLLTGEAALIAIILVNFKNVSEILCESYLKWALYIFAVSILAGAIVKLLSVAVDAGVTSIDSMREIIDSDEGTANFKNLKLTQEDLKLEISKVFLWPLSTLVSNQKSEDQLLGEKRFVKLVCIQIYAAQNSDNNCDTLIEV
ncbi:hypothetical protein [Shewanella baltica]|uniref:hypothetical protein n=1 Tax=Shewanella baltica TaxID=62322 RepID=UPI00059EA064|nr:hypothetical protein [Shewanella baltica]